MICWYCYWGWPKPVADIFLEYRDKLGYEGVLEYGPAHSVWCDENFGDETIRSSLTPESFDNPDYWPDYTNESDKPLVRESLEKLLLVPEDIRCCEPEDYDGVHPENFPPPQGMEMVRI